MKKIILDCDLMRFRDSGLYHYCLNLGVYVQQVLEKEGKESIAFYVPATEKGSFGQNAKIIVEKKWHKLFKPFLMDCDLWLAPFQSGRVLPEKGKKTKILLTIHDLNVLHEGKPEKEIRESLSKTQNLIDRSDALVCISEHSKNDVLQNLDIKGKPIHVIHNGTHNVTVPPDNPRSYKPTRPFIFTMGYVNQKKNFHTLVPLLEDPEIELVVAGKLDEPDYIASMKQYAAKLGFQERLHILGPVSEEDKAWYFNNCRAFMLPSLAEGFGAPVVEAMKFGKPIFLSSKTSLPEIGGDVSFYFENFSPDTMLKVYRNGMSTYHSNGLKEKIRERGKKFSWEQKAREYVQLYRSLL